MDQPTDIDRKSRDKTGFRIANGPLMRGTEHEQNATDVDLAQLPRIYGRPIFFALARDPRTIFAYWNVDWGSIFASGEPFDKSVYLRVLKATGETESESPVQPMLGVYYATVSRPRADYRVELGYYESAGAWRTVAISDPVTMPPEDASEKLDVDVATVPFHLSFQKMIDLFRGSQTDSLTTLVSRLQGRALTDEDRQDLTREEHEILQAMNVSLSDLAAARRSFSDAAAADRLRKRAEAILGFGESSPSAAFGGSSWGSSPS